MTLPPLSPNILPYDWQQAASDELVSVVSEPIIDHQTVQTEVITRKLVNGNYTGECDRKIINEKVSVSVTRDPLGGALLRAGTGTGKMYMAAGAIRTLLAKDLLVKPEGSINPFRVLWLTPKSVKAQTQKVIFEHGLTTHVMVMSYSEIKSSMGAMYVTWVDNGAEKQPVWNENMLPALVKCDECQVLKNPKSQQSRVVRALPESVRSIFASATPFQRTVDAITLCERFSVVTPYNTIKCSKSTSEKLVSEIASPKKRDEYSPSAVERLRNALNPYIVELKNVRFKFPSHTKCVSIAFKTVEEQAQYNRLVEILIENLNKRKGRDEDSYVFFLVEMQKMQQGAELLRKHHIADRVVSNMDSKAVIVASNFVGTIEAVYDVLVNERGINPERIAIVKGGQKSEVRQAMVNDFQKGKRDILLFTMRSGGVGISLHHDRVSTKPRHIILPPTWSAIDLVQALGRGHRLTSLSPTTQEILWYGGTIEDVVKLRVELKIKCLSKAVTAKEQFIDTFISEIDRTIEAEKLVEVDEKNRHSGEDSESDDIDSANVDDSLTGEGLDEQVEATEFAA